MPEYAPVTSPAFLFDALRRDGAVLAAGAAVALLPAIEALFAAAPRDGRRLGGGLDGVAGGGGTLDAVAAACIGARARPVRALLFEKTVTSNWSLGWHQDRTVVVRRRIEVPGFGNWTIKRGMQHVEPPPAILAEMATLRIHLDPVRADGAPLRIAPGSHRLGRIAERDIETVVERTGERVCLAAAGDVWAYATPILHASGTTAAAGRRRVLQLDYAVGPLPGGLDG